MCANALLNAVYREEFPGPYSWGICHQVGKVKFYKWERLNFQMRPLRCYIKKTGLYPTCKVQVPCSPLWAVCPPSFLSIKCGWWYPPARTMVGGQGDKGVIVHGDPRAEGQIKAPNHRSCLGSAAWPSQVLRSLPESGSCQPTLISNTCVTLLPLPPPLLCFLPWALGVPMQCHSLGPEDRIPDVLTGLD